VTGLAAPFIYQLQSEGRFPRRIKIGVRAVGWSNEMSQWLDDRIADSREQSDVSECGGDGKPGYQILRSGGYNGKRIEDRLVVSSPFYRGGA